MALLEDLWRYRCLTTTQLEILRRSDVDPSLRFVSRLTLTRRLKLLFHARYVRRLARPSTGGMREPVYLLDKEGARHLSQLHGEVTVRAPSQLPKLASLEHLLAINQFRISLTAACAAARAYALSQSDTEIPLRLLEWKSSTVAKFTVVLPDGSDKYRAARKVSLIPDAGFTLKAPPLKLFYFLEVDLGSEAGRVLADKCRAYAAFWQSGGFAREYSVAANVGFRVLFVAPTPKRAQTILGAIQKLEAGKSLFRVALQDQITPRELLRPIWQGAGQEGRKSSLTGA